jgi:hypothetical protein
VVFLGPVLNAELALRFYAKLQTSHADLSVTIKTRPINNINIVIITIIIIIIIIRVYLRANLTAQRPITKLARVHRNTQK